ncbi:MAG: hypothetical protein AAF573_21355 [Bacteroidota bacterium]
MPAKQEHLSSKGERWLKVSAGILGGFLLAIAVHLAIAANVEDKGVIIITSAYSTFFLWIFLMIFAFLFKKGWKAWATYLLGMAICAGFIYMGQ